jgi:uncharacterized protein (TIGR02284 family)
MKEEIITKVIETLSQLIEICVDGEKGFDSAAEGLDDNNLKAMCIQYSLERGHFARELQEEVRAINGTPEISGTVAGTLHRGWIDIKAAVTNKDEDAIIAECERGENIAKQAYEKALNDYLPPSVTGVVQRQYQKVLASHDRFSALQKAAH